MKISPKVCLTKQQEVIAVCCAKTGITSALVIPALPAMANKRFVLEYVHPLAYWSNAQGLVKAGRAYLERLDSMVLAGLVLTAYEHYELLDRYTLSAQEANSILCTASKDTLVDLVWLASLFTPKNVVGTPALVLEWSTDIKYLVTIDRTLASYAKTLRSEFINPVGDQGGAGSARDRITVLNAKAFEGRKFNNGVTLLSAKQSLADHEKDFEQFFKAAKKECKELLVKLVNNPRPIDLKLAGFLKSILQNRSLVAMSADIRAKVCDKLNAYSSPEADRMAELIKQCHNPYDIFAKADDLLERASDTFVKADKPRTLAEILEAKRLAKQSGYDLGNNTSSTSDASTNLVDPMNPSGADDVDELLSTRIIEGGSDELEGPVDELEAGDSQEADGLVDVYTQMTSGIHGPEDF